ncbi:hypothetical protein [Sphingopyxis flava]|uniref:Uncharacterized protein n=1 Tax=Sphingopyxis flava TaxID=1507287 RepID=A0A1T5CIF2_9SPHN|nr:hypothetical protein [Sphingopyxis flava]SKB59133.1 hypothetical protein SAMN06295937_101089 [Sphingopyxis flava]
MSFLFLFLFLAAIVGVFKPYLGGWKRWHFGLAAFASFILVGIFAPEPDAASLREAETSEKGQSAAAAPTGGKVEAAAAARADESNWDYSESTDEMRGTTTKFARVVSANEVDLDFPYGVVNGYLTVRQQKKDGLSIIFSVDKGQILCHSFSDGYVSVKFDDQPIRRFSCTGASDGSSDLAFILNERSFLASLKKSKKVIIEGEFFQKGNQQFTFKTEGLNWQ